MKMCLLLAVKAFLSFEMFLSDMKMFNSIVRDSDWFSSSGGVIPLVCEHLSGGMCSLVIYRVMESNIETAAFFMSFWNIESLYSS